MSKSVLVSAVGTADPLTMLGDGPMLHLVRHLEPEVVVLLFSAEMWKHEHEEGEGYQRYSRAIEKLAKQKLKDPPLIEKIEIQEPDIWRHDLLIPEFRNCLSQVCQKYPKAKIILNLTSGTAAMGEAFLVLHAFGLFPTRAFQVSTPSGKRNEREDRENPNDYEFSTLWELNPDNDLNSKNRCHEVQSQNFQEALLKDNIKALVRNYDFAGAYNLAKQFPLSFEQAMPYLAGAVSRFNLNNTQTARVKWDMHTKYSPQERLYEYLSVLEVYVLRNQWGDFLRAMTPALFETLIGLVRNQGLDDELWLVEKKSGEVLISQERLRKLGSVYDAVKVKSYSKEYKGQIGYETLYSSHLIDVLVHLEQNGAKPKNKNSNSNIKKVEALREMESRLRNKVAHQITSTNKQEFEKQSGLTFEKALGYLFELSGYSNRRGLYQKIADLICSNL